MLVVGVKCSTLTSMMTEFCSRTLERWRQHCVMEGILMSILMFRLTLQTCHTKMAVSPWSFLIRHTC